MAIPPPDAVAARVRPAEAAMREKLAALAHSQWSGWMEYLFSKCHEDSQGMVVIPASMADRWRRQMRTDYANLPESEKESDRVEADRMLALIRENE